MSDRTVCLFPQDYFEVKEQLIFFLEPDRIGETELQQILCELKSVKMLLVTRLAQNDESKWFFVAYLKNMALLFSEGLSQNHFRFTHVYSGEDFQKRYSELSTKRFLTIVPSGGVRVVYLQNLQDKEADANCNMNPEAYQELLSVMTHFFEDSENPKGSRRGKSGINPQKEAEESNAEEQEADLETIEQNLLRIKNDILLNRQEILSYEERVNNGIEVLRQFREKEKISKEKTKSINLCLTDLCETGKRIEREASELEALIENREHKRIFLEIAKKRAFLSKTAIKKSVKRAEEELKNSGRKLADGQKQYQDSIYFYQQRISELKRLRDEMRAEGTAMEYQREFYEVQKLLFQMNSEKEPFYPNFQGEFHELWKVQTAAQTETELTLANLEERLQKDISWVTELQSSLDQFEWIIQKFEQSVLPQGEKKDISLETETFPEETEQIMPEENQTNEEVIDTAEDENPQIIEETADTKSDPLLKMQASIPGLSEMIPEYFEPFSCPVLLAETVVKEHMEAECNIYDLLMLRLYALGFREALPLASIACRPLSAAENFLVTSKTKNDLIEEESGELTETGQRNLTENEEENKVWYANRLKKYKVQMEAVTGSVIPPYTLLPEKSMSRLIDFTMEGIPPRNEGVNLKFRKSVDVAELHCKKILFRQAFLVKFLGMQYPMIVFQGEEAAFPSAVAKTDAEFLMSKGIDCSELLIRSEEDFTYLKEQLRELSITPWKPFEPEKKEEKEENASVLPEDGGAL